MIKPNNSFLSSDFSCLRWRQTALRLPLTPPTGNTCTPHSQNCSQTKTPKILFPGQFRFVSSHLLETLAWTRPGAPVSACPLGLTGGRRQQPLIQGTRSLAGTLVPALILVQDTWRVPAPAWLVSSSGNRGRGGARGVGGL